MYDKLTSIMNYTYNAPPDINSLPLLFHVHRAGCNLQNEDFEIIRNDDYPFYTLHILFEGYGFFHIENTDYFLKSGDMFLIFPGHAHTYSNCSASIIGMLWIEFSGDACDKLFSNFLAEHIFSFQNVSTNKLIECLISILTYLKSEPELSPYEISQKVYSLIMNLLEQGSKIKTLSHDDLFFRALTFIDTHLTSPFKVHDISHELHISDAHLSRIFKKNLGTSTIKYITFKKLEYACFLLRTTHLNSEEISQILNFYDNSYFHKVFKEKLGMTPKEYRFHI